jgi:DNA polymerase-3 subunit gamma/tau
VKIAKKETPLVAASPSEQKKLSETAAKFSEEDLTRFLQLSLDLFTDLQASLQPRLHLEMGLLRMVHAGKLQSIEEALASVAGPSSGTQGGGGGRAPRPAADPSIGRSSAPQTQTAPSPVQATAPVPAAPTSGDLRSKLHATFVETKQMLIADAVEHSAMTESGSELIITTPKIYTLYFKEAAFDAAVKRILGRPVKITIKTGEAQAAPMTPAAPRADEARERAMANPEVQRFQELFPDSQVRTVRNLREN